MSERSTSLLKEVGKSQYKDGVRINKAFHEIFNSPADSNYVSKGKARDITVSFNGKDFSANYRYEGTLASDTELQRIGFHKGLIDEFWSVFPNQEGAFSISKGKDINHFVFTVERVGQKSSDSLNVWTERECFFAVWCYDLMDLDRSLVKTELYDHVSSLVGRSVKSIEWKVQNVSACDSRPRSEKPISEAPNVQKMLKDVFDWYWRDRECARGMYDTFHQGAQFQVVSRSETFEVPEKFIIEEGSPGVQTYKARSRSTKLVKKAREYFSSLESDRKLRCKSCGFSKPDEVAREIVQIHHLSPISDSGGGTKMDIDTALRLVVPLCPTCHQIAHSVSPPMSPAAVRDLVV